MKFHSRAQNYIPGYETSYPGATLAKNDLYGRFFTTGNFPHTVVGWGLQFSLIEEA
jgi:hypothetical protein